MFDNVPFYYDYQNAKVSPVTPNTTHQLNTGVCRYFERYLLQKAMSVFNFTLPEHWEKNYFLYVLYCFGSITVLDTKKFGVIPQFATPNGYTVFYQPMRMMVANPLLPEVSELIIGKECTVIKLMPDWGGVMDIVQYYAAQMATISTTFEQNANLSKMATVFAAKDKQAAESYKKMVDKLLSGDVAAFADKSLFTEDGKPTWQLFIQNLKQSYIGTELLDDLRTVENRFCTTVGIPNANTDKKERLISDEVNANNTETQSLASLWLEELRKGIEQTNAMFGLDISVDWRNKPEESEVANDESNVNIDGVI